MSGAYALTRKMTRRRFIVLKILSRVARFLAPNLRTFKPVGSHYLRAAGLRTTITP